ncbi:hypothetical protein [Zavarzinella formosa]|uniref:hypothetical protein n=1 Tax=Zavarzinella formosa TaxID=360055 RepID=UPI00037FB28B|nr:hypothetical protein [Zavarzinella formosa]
MRALICRLAALAVCLGLAACDPKPEVSPSMPEPEATPAAPVAVPADDSPLSKIKFEYEVFAMADGPCVLCLSMTNTGGSAIGMIGWTDEAILADLLDSPWDCPNGFTTGGIGRIGGRYYHLKPWQTNRLFFSFHHDYQIATTPAQIEVLAKFRNDDRSEGRSAVLVDFSREITVKPSVNNATTKKELIARIIKYGLTLPSEERMTFYCDCVVKSKIKEFLPLALETARQGESYHASSLVDWMIEILPPDEFWRLFEAEGLSAASPKPTVWMYCAYLRSKTNPVGEPQYRMMRASPSPLARLSATNYFPKCFTPAEIKSLLAEAEKWKPPVTPDELQNNVQLLGSKSFRRREEAAARLRSFGERGVAPLSKLLESAADPEIQDRLKTIIEQGKAARPSAGDQHFFRDMADWNANESLRIAILSALTKNDPASLIVRQAEKALAEFSENKKRHARIMQSEGTLSPD